MSFPAIPSPSNRPSPSGVHLGALSIAGLLALIKLATDAYMATALARLSTMYAAVWKEQCKSCTVPPWFLEWQGERWVNDKMRRSWANVAYERRFVLNFFWQRYMYVNVAFSAVVLLYLLSFAIVRARSANRDGEWIWVRSDLILLPLLAAFGGASGALFLFIRWPFMLRSGGWDSKELLGAHVCSDLGKDCLPAKFGMLIVWPIAGILMALAVFEFIYVTRHHGGRLAWLHSLYFLQSIPVHERRKKDAYLRVEKTANGVKYQDGGAVDLFVPEETPLIPFPLNAYQGQGDAPPMYTGPAEGMPSMGYKAEAFSTLNPAGSSSQPDAGPSSGPSTSRPVSEYLPSFAEANAAPKTDAAENARKAALAEMAGKGPRR